MARARVLKTTSDNSEKIAKLGQAWEAERCHLQDELNRIHDRWVAAIAKGDLQASENIWREFDRTYQKLMDHLPITPTG